MERRYALFIAASLAIVLVSQVLQVTLFPKPPAVEQAADQAEGNPAEGSPATKLQLSPAAAGASTPGQAGTTDPADGENAAEAEAKRRKFKWLGHEVCEGETMNYVL